MILLTVEEVTATGSAWPWLTPLIAVMTLLLGGGGIAALYKARSDAKHGVAQQETAEDDALTSRWKTIIQTQTEVLLEPMRVRLTELEEKIGRLEGELETSRRKYWNAVAYIRTLLIWINRHMPPDLEDTAIPEASANIAEDI